MTRTVKYATLISIMENEATADLVKDCMRHLIPES